MSKYLTKQWSFLWAGIAFGIAQIVYMVGTFVPKWVAGDTPSVKPMTVTSDLGKSFRAIEVWLSHTFGFNDPQLYGNSEMVDGVAISSAAVINGVLDAGEVAAGGTDGGIACLSRAT